MRANRKTTLAGALAGVALAVGELWPQYRALSASVAVLAVVLLGTFAADAHSNRGHRP